MSKFVYVNGYCINKDIVARVQYPYRDKEYGTIYFKDGTYTKADLKKDKSVHVWSIGFNPKKFFITLTDTEKAAEYE